MAIDLAAIEAERARLHAEYVQADRPESSARGIHHTALLSSDVERTIRFYAGILEFPLTEIIENRDYAGSNHFFFDVGHGNLLAFFDFPGLDLGPYAEVLGGLHHLAISVTPQKWAALRANLDAAGIDYVEESGVSLYFRDPDGNLLEVATKKPGYTVDESQDELGTRLVLPKWLEPKRSEIETRLKHTDQRNSMAAWPPRYRAPPSPPEEIMNPLQEGEGR